MPADPLYGTTRKRDELPGILGELGIVPPELFLVERMYPFNMELERLRARLVTTDRLLGLDDSST